MDDNFTYKSFRIGEDRQTVSFDYAISHKGSRHNLTETLKFPVALDRNASQLAALRALHLALGVSYYKIFVCPRLIHPYQMSVTEAEFWNNVWRHGLGEFLYDNQLSPDKLARFNAQSGDVFPPGKLNESSQAAILGIGGGKDSVVAGELLKSLEMDVAGFVMATGEQLGQAKAVADTMGIALYVVERSLDKQLLVIQEQQDAYKGHIPISLIFGLVGTVLATATGNEYIVVANEASASIPGVSWEHGSVNHQWSKSFEFELRLQSFIHDSIAPQATYFSAIRPLTSIAVAKMFTRYPQYFEVFTSDNFVFRIDPDRRPNARWSLESPKSLSSFILLSPWLSETNMLRTFGKNFLDEPSLEKLFWELTGQEGHPPLDCVGTVKELVVSLNLMFEQGKFKDSHLVTLAQDRGVIAAVYWQRELVSMLELQPEPALPEHIAQRILQHLQKALQS